jgi:hypothetical protein
MQHYTPGATTAFQYTILDSLLIRVLECSYI